MHESLPNDWLVEEAEFFFDVPFQKIFGLYPRISCKLTFWFERGNKNPMKIFTSLRTLVRRSSLVESFPLSSTIYYKEEEIF
jgi:hypothetical protein